MYSGVAQSMDEAAICWSWRSNGSHWKRVRRVRVRATIRRLRNNVKVLLKGSLDCRLRCGGCRCCGIMPSTIDHCR